MIGRGFWTERLMNHGPGPIRRIEGSGWKVVYDEIPSEMESSGGKSPHFVDAAYSIGLDLRDDGGITDTIEGICPQPRAGIGPGMKVVAGQRPQVLA